MFLFFVESVVVFVCCHLFRLFVRDLGFALCPGSCSGVFLVLFVFVRYYCYCSLVLCLFLVLSVVFCCMCLILSLMSTGT